MFFTNPILLICKGELSMKVINASKKVPPSERLRCSLCECEFEILISDLYDVSYSHKGKIGYVNCPSCNAKLKVYELKCIDPMFKLWFSLEELIPKHIL